MSDNDAILLPCRVLSKRFASSNFAVLAVEIDNHSSHFPESEVSLPMDWISGRTSFTVQVSTDFDADFEEMATYVFSGVMNDHPKYGEQFKSNYFFPDIPTSSKAISHYLYTMPQIGGARKG